MIVSDSAAFMRNETLFENPKPDKTKKKSLKKQKRKTKSSQKTMDIIFQNLI